MTVFVALDPGLMSGLAKYTLETEEFSSTQLDIEGTGRYLLEAVAEHGTDLRILVERFTVTRETLKKTWQPWSIEMTGFARVVSRLYTGRDIVLYSTAEAKNKISNQRLKYLNWRRPSPGGHQDDAARVLVAHLMNNHLLSEDKLRALARL